MCCPNVAELPIVYYGVLKPGCVVVPLNTLLTGRELAYHLRDSEVAAFVCFDDGADDRLIEAGRRAFNAVASCRNLLVVRADGVLRASLDSTKSVDMLDGALLSQSTSFQHQATSESDTAVILYTSGTTGQPKGVELTHANLVPNAMADNRAYGPAPGASDVQLVALPLFHSFGANAQMNAGISVGSTSVLLKRFSARAAVDLMNAEGVTVFGGVPTMYFALLEEAEDDAGTRAALIRLRTALSGGAPLPQSLHERFRDDFGVALVEGYGLTETSPGCRLTDPSQWIRFGSVGVPMWGVEVALVDAAGKIISGESDGHVGEIVVRGHNVMKGYYRRPEETAEAVRAGWLHTGDLAWRDDGGCYYIVDRLKDLIIRGGFNVYPREIEELQIMHPGVSQVAVVGVPHPRHGEEIVAFVVPGGGGSVDEAEIRGWAKERLAAYQYPREVVLLEEMPSCSSGEGPCDASREEKP